MLTYENFNIDYYTWLLFHSIVHQITDESFLNIRFIILKYIYLISSNHYCGLCREHSTNYFNNTVIQINTKVDFINFLFHYHNYVNTLTNKSLFDHDDLKQYCFYSISEIIENLNKLFLEKNTVYTIHYTQLFDFYKNNSQYFTDN